MNGLLLASDLTLKHLRNIRKLYTYISYPKSKFGVRRLKQTQIITLYVKTELVVSNSDFDLVHRHLGSNPKLRFD